MTQYLLNDIPLWWNTIVKKQIRKNAYWQTYVERQWMNLIFGDNVVLKAEEPELSTTDSERPRSQIIRN